VQQRKVRKETHFVTTNNDEFNQTETTEIMGYDIQIVCKMKELEQQQSSNSLAYFNVIPF